MAKYNQPVTSSLLIPFEFILGGLMQRKRFSIVTRALLVALFLLTLLPVSLFAQRRWIVVRPRRSVVVYQPRSYVIYQRPSSGYRYSYPQAYYNNGYDSYGYSQPYYTNGYYSSGYSQPYYTNQYYSYQYSQPYFANRYTYSWANPTYGYGYPENYRRHRRNGVSLRLILR
jgi:hypothetical protein